MLKAVCYRRHRNRVLPIIQSIAGRNRHDFANSVDLALLQGRACLFVNGDGFVALQPMSKQRVLVLFAFTWSENAMERYDGEMVRLAKLVGGKTLIFQSTRKGFRRLAKRFGYKITSRFGRKITYAKEI